MDFPQLKSLTDAVRPMERRRRPERLSMLHDGQALATTGARGLGWASVGIGLAELAAPKQVENALGLDDRPNYRGILRVLGVRELMHGFSLLTARSPSATMTASLWSRVAGDMLDTAVLALAATKTKRPTRFATLAAIVIGIGVLDAIHTWQLQRQESDEC